MKKQLSKFETMSETPKAKVVGRINSCNICRGPYVRSNRFQRFCDRCRSRSELYRLHEWMPITTCYA